MSIEIISLDVPPNDGIITYFWHQFKSLNNTFSCNMAFLKALCNMVLTFHGSVICTALIIFFIMFVASCTKGGKRRAHGNVHVVYGPMWFTELCNSVAFERLSPWPDAANTFLFHCNSCLSSLHSCQHLIFDRNVIWMTRKKHLVAILGNVSM